MLKRVHKQTALSLHKNTTKLTSIDTQVQISEYIGGLNLPSNAVCYARIQVWYPCAVKKLGRNFKRPASIDRRISHPVQSDFCHMQTGGSGIWQFRKFFVYLCFKETLIPFIFNCQTDIFPTLFNILFFCQDYNMVAET